MTLYTTYQCSICRRKKDIIKDDKRAIPNLCVITKGCGGRLFPVGETTSASATAQVAGLTDWYPRGTAFNADSIEIEVEKPPVKLSTTSTASITVAVSFASGVTPPQELSATLTQRKIEDISFQQYIFNTSKPSNIFSGRDSTGNNLRFDTTAIYQGRVFVLVNGIPKFNGEDLILTPNTVTFPAYFRISDGAGNNNFIIKLTDSTKIQKARDLLDSRKPGRTPIAAKHVTGLIIKQTADYNPGYSYHYDPSSIDFFEVAMEVCDFTFSYTEDHLLEAGGAFLPGLRLCPWSSEIIEEIYPKDLVIPVGSVVNVGVYVERNTVQRTLNFVRNDAQTSFQGAWYNIRHVAFPPSNDRWVLYTCNEIGDFTTSSRARLDKFESQPGVSIPLGNVKFLLASEPYGFLDRNMNFVANADEFGQNFCITAKLESVNELYIESQFIKEIYPPIHLKSEVPDSSFILEDSYEGISVTNEIFPNLISSKIIGPT